MLKRKKKAIQEAIEAAWSCPSSLEFREKLFPEGKPDPDTFIRRLADCARHTPQEEIS